MPPRRDSTKAQILEALALGQSVRKVHEEMGKPLSTLYKWRADLLTEIPPLNRSYAVDELRLMLHRADNDTLRLRIFNVLARLLPDVDVEPALPTYYVQIQTDAEPNADAASE